ncbi:hypothetical protein O181_038113 [Austropuccinia psidii MF-1]|uniref:Uncharacterized protein n=1 Tax=Austropuccinia psidii MF-1 TaxID=1389203 RepID=A0A9Q3HAQ9_9BASI|nr:hypothetical protein [Austropuccinia psidii MF-1]
MVQTRKGSNHSVQPDGCGQGRGKNKSRSVKSSPRKTHMEDARVSPHSPKSVPTNVQANSESGLIHDNILRAEPLSSVTHQELSGSGEDHRALTRLEPIILQRQSQKDKELVEESKSFIPRPEEGVGNDSGLETEGPVASTSSKPAPEVSKDKPKGPQKQ